MKTLDRTKRFDSSVLPDYTAESDLSSQQPIEAGFVCRPEDASRTLISRPEASVWYRRSETSMWRDERDGLIPNAIRINGRKFWLKSELDEAYGLTGRGAN